MAQPFRNVRNRRLLAMYRVLAASLGALALIMLVQNAPATNQLFAAPAPVVVMAPQQVPALRGARAGQPMMYGGIAFDRFEFRGDDC